MYPARTDLTKMLDTENVAEYNSSTILLDGVPLMKNTLTLHGFSPAKQLTLTAMFATLCLIGTLLITIPLPTGYFNVGDVFVLLAGWCLGPFYGAVAGAVGSALADVVSGFAVYAPITFFLKGAVAFLCAILYRIFKRPLTTERFLFVPRAFSAIIAESVMVLGYFLWELLLYGFGGAIIAVLGNVLQGACCSVCAVVIVSILYPIKGTQRTVKAKENRKNNSF